MAETTSVSPHIPHYPKQLSPTIFHFLARQRMKLFAYWFVAEQLLPLIDKRRCNIDRRLELNRSYLFKLEGGASYTDGLVLNSSYLFQLEGCATYTDGLVMNTSYLFQLEGGATYTDGWS
jgi:hypothetical protein